MADRLSEAEKKKRDKDRVAAWRKKNPDKVKGYNEKYAAERKAKKAA